jgi:hypothetical protein
MLGDEQALEIVLISDLRAQGNLLTHFHGIQVRRITAELNTKTHPYHPLALDREGWTSLTENIPPKGLAFSLGFLSSDIEAVFALIFAFCSSLPFSFLC